MKRTKRSTGFTGLQMLTLSKAL